MTKTKTTEKKAATPVVARAKKAAPDTTTRAQRNLVRKARSLKPAELKTFVAKHREDLKAVAAATTRRKIAGEAQKLLK